MGSPLVERELMRCNVCSAWWSYQHMTGDPVVCACGGALVGVDWQKHMAALPDGTKACPTCHESKITGRATCRDVFHVEDAEFTETIKT